MTAAKNNIKDMTVGSPMKLIFFFSIPLLIGNIFQQLYSMVDTVIVGRTLGADALAAVGTTGPLSFLVLGFISGLTSGFAVITAQYFGAHDEVMVRRSVGTIIKLCVAIVIAMTVVSVLAARPLLRLINTPDNIIEDAWRYIVTIFAGIATMVLYNMLSCILRALGDSKTPLVFLIISSLLNVGLDFLFILVFHLGVTGAALATVISQGVSGVLCFLYIKKRFPILQLQKADYATDGKFIWRHLRIGLPMAFQFSITAIGVVVLQGALNLFGSVKIAAYTAASKAEQLTTQAAVSFGVTMANYAGQNLGANRIDRIKKGVVSSTILSMIFAAFGMLVLFLFGEELTSLFVDSSEENYGQILEAAAQYLRICAIFFPPLFLIFIYRNTLQGMGHSVMPLMAGVFELVARVVVSLTLPAVLGYVGICLAGPIAWLSAAIPLAIAYFVLIRKLTKRDKSSALTL